MDIKSLPNAILLPSVMTDRSVISDVTRTSAPNLADQPSFIITIDHPDGYAANEVYARPRPIFDLTVDTESPDIALESQLSDKLTSEHFYAGYDNIAGLLPNIGTLIDSGEDSIEQTTSYTVYNSKIINFDPIEHLERTERYSAKDGELSFALQTADGDLVKLNLAFNYEGGELGGNAGSYASKNIALNFSVEGELSKKEQQAIEKLAIGLENQIKRVTSGREIRFNDLNIFDDKVISSVDVSAKIGRYSTEAFSLTMTNSAESKSIDYKAGFHEIQLALDSNNLFANKPGTQAEIESLIKTLKEGINKSDDVTGFGKSLIDAATMIFGQPLVQRVANTEQQAAQSVMSGLPDFQLEYSNAIPDEFGRPIRQIDMSAKQLTEFSQEGKTVEAKQIYQYELKYNPSDSLIPLDGLDMQNGRFLKKLGHETHTRQSEFATDERGDVVKATIEKTATEAYDLVTMQDGEITDSRRFVDKTSQLSDYTADVAAAQSQNTILLIKDIVDHLQINKQGSKQRALNALSIG